MSRELKSRRDFSYSRGEESKACVFESLHGTAARYSFFFSRQNSERPSGCLTRTATVLSRKKNSAGLCAPWDNSRERRNWGRCCRRSTLTVSNGTLLSKLLDCSKVRKQNCIVFPPRSLQFTANIKIEARYYRVLYAPSRYVISYRTIEGTRNITIALNLSIQYKRNKIMETNTWFEFVACNRDLNLRYR